MQRRRFLFSAALAAPLLTTACSGRTLPRQSDTASTNGFCTAYVNVFTLRKVRTRVGSKLRPAEHPAAAAAPALASRPLHAQPDTAPQQTPPILKIVQREPRKQPECLLISGRMADVCAALERMARNERALHA